MSEVYLNFAATSHPRPECVIRRMSGALVSPPCDGRRGASGGGDPLQDCRRALARLLGARDPNRIVLTPGATVALNHALQGCVIGLENAAGRARAGRRRKPGVLTTVLEHNSVLRPLHHMLQAGRIDLGYLGIEEVTDPGRLEGRLRDGVDLLAITACSNVTGLIPDFGLVTELCRRHGVILVLDAAQAAGSVAIDVSMLPPRSLVALAGHKGLLGPQGTGALYVGEGLSDEDVPPFMQGGTGVRSDSAGQPSDLPLRLEAGTPNIPGFAGLSAGVEFVSERGVDELGRHKASLTARLVGGMERCEGIRIFASPEADHRGGVVSFTLRGWDPREAAMVIEESFGIWLRGGLHCAPLIHRHLGVPEGSVRASVGWCSTVADVDALLDAVSHLSARAA